MQLEGSHLSIEELRLQGLIVNHKRVLRVMRDDNLLSLRKRKFVVTTDSTHGRLVYPNLIAGSTPTALNQVWVSDIRSLSVNSI